MKIIVLGAGTIGISTAWHLIQRGHQVTVVERQPGAALETSFANGAQISVSYCEPWANREAPLKALKWMLSKEAPLLFRPQNPFGQGIHQYTWGLSFLANCNDRAFERNVQQLVALGSYSHAALKQIVAETGMEYNRLQRGIAHFYCDQKSFEGAGAAAELMRKYGVDRRVVSKEEFLRIEPAYKAYADQIVGGTYTPGDESGDCLVFTQKLADLCVAQGAKILYGHEIVALQPNSAAGGGHSVLVRPVSQDSQRNTPQSAQPSQNLSADHIIVACGSFSAPLLRTVGVSLPIYPGKGYSATFPILKPEQAPSVSALDDSKKVAISRIGNHIRVAGTIEVGSYDLSLDSDLSRARCHMLSRRIEEVLPGVCDTRTEEQGGTPNYWTGLRPATPTNIPFIGQTPIRGLWVNAGHGTLGWTHAAGSGKAIAELIAGNKPELAFKFYGA